MQKVLTTTL